MGQKASKDLLWQKILISEGKNKGKAQVLGPVSHVPVGSAGAGGASERGGNTSQSDQISMEQVLYNTFSDPKKLMREYLNPSYLLDSLEIKSKDKNDNTDEMKPLKVKLCIIDLDGWKDSKILNMFGFTKYGLVHVAVQIGPCIIHWFNDSLVHFTDQKSTTPRISVDVGELDFSKKTTLDIIESICKECVEWNKTKKYDNMKCNCHHFSDKILDIMGMDTGFQGQLGSYIQALRTQGASIQKYFIDPDTKQKVVFNTHKELDIYSAELFKRIPGFTTKQEYMYDHALLKSFDRAFWLGHHAQESLPDDKRSDTFEPYKCVFKNPFDTASFLPRKRP